MAAFEDIFGPVQPVDAAEPPPAPPWAWVPPEWLSAPPVAASPIPVPADAAAAPAPSVLEVNQPGIPVPAEALAAAAEQLPATEPTQAPTTQPGTGIPAEAFDYAMKALPSDEPVVLPWLQDKLGLPELPEQAALPPEQPEGEDGGYGVEALSTDPTVADRVDALLSLDPETRERVMGEQEADKARWFAERQREELAKQREAAERNARTYQEAVDRAQKNSEAIAADALALADTKIDRGRWWSTRSTGQKIAAFIAAIVGGAYQGRTGGARNQGLDGIEALINEDVNAQAAELANKKDLLGLRRGMVAEQLGRSGDAFRAAESVRLAAYETVVRDLEAEAQQYDPRGSTARDIARSIADMRARQAAALAKLSAEERDRQLKIWEAQAKADQEARDLAERERHNRKQEALEGWRIAVDRDDKRDGRTLEARKLELEAQKLEAEGKKKEADLVRTRAIGYATGRVVKDDKGNLVPEFGTLTNADGSTYIPPTDKEAQDLRSQKASVDDVNAWVNELIREIDEYGGESSWIKSGSYQRRISNMGFIAEKIRSGAGMGALDAGTERAIKNMVGGVDPNSHVHDAVEGLKQGAKNLTRQFNTNLRASQYTGDDYLPPDTSKVGAARSAQDAALKKSLSWQTDASLYGKSHDVIRSILPQGASGEMVEEAARGYTTGQQREIDALAETAAGDGAAAANAKAKLKVYATKSDSPGLRSYAKAALDNKVEADNKPVTDQYGTPLPVPDVSRFRE